VKALRSVMLLLLLAGVICAAQDPSDSADRPPGNVNELTLAGLRPGESTIAAAQARYGPHWAHPSPDEKDLYVWCDASSQVQLSLEAASDGTIQVVTVERLLHPAAPAQCDARLPLAIAHTGRGVQLGDTPQQLRHVYGKPFFVGPSSWDGKNVQFIVFNFSWAGESDPQILESSFDGPRLVKMTLSAQYY
jgi:hypothetical protein